MQDIYDPFSFLLSEIRAFDAGERAHWEPYQRQHYLDVLLADEAEEIAWGRRHLTVVHGSQADDIEAELLDELFAAWEDIAACATWGRIGGVARSHLTLTLAGDLVEHLMASALDAARDVNPGAWRITEEALA